MFEHSGPVLVCGSAWCLSDDLALARAFYPDAPVIAANGAAEHVRADHLYSQHPLKIPRWLSRHEARFGSRPVVHAGGASHWRNNLGCVPETPWVDYRWYGVASKGSSGWGARRLAAALGFDLVILCGMPMDPGGYEGGGISKVNTKPHVMDHYREHILRDTALHVGVLSMSGWTRTQFGSVE